MAQHGSGRRPWWRLALVVVVVAVAAGAGWWAGRSTLSREVAEGAIQDGDVVVTVRQESVGRSLALSVTVTQPFRPVATGLLPGIVTQTPDVATVSDGDVVYRVNDVPVRVVAGDTPFFRALTPGLQGSDVTQLQKTLSKLGFLVGDASGTFDAVTTTAVKKWQEQLRQPVSGTIALGELVALPSLPTAVRLGPAVVLGGSLAGGEPTVLARTGQPTFQLVVSPQQAELIPSDAIVTMRWEQSAWAAVITDTATDPDNSSRVVLSLASPNGGLPCGQQCDLLPADESVSLRSTVQIVPETVGPAIPAAAVHTGADGSVSVRLADGTSRAVTVLASANGLVIVDGVNDGEQVLALAGGTADDSGGPPASNPSMPSPSGPPGSTQPADPSTTGGG